MAIEEISQLLDSKDYDRQATLNAWLQLKGMSKAGLARSLGVHPSMISRIISGQRAPAERIRQLVALGIPPQLLPTPTGRGRGRPRHRADNTTGDAEG